MRPSALSIRRDPRAPIARLWPALAVSALAHLLGASVLDIEPVPDPSPADARTPFDARIETLPLPAPPVAEPAAPTDPAAAVRPRAGRKAIASRGQDDAAIALRERIAVLAHADPVVYTARELDALPRPVAPLDLGRQPDVAGPRRSVRLELTIDESGAVREASFEGAGTRGTAEKALLAAISAAAFIPARKDGRPVKSRVTLDVTLEDSSAGNARY